MRVLDALLAFPALLLAILVVATFGSGLDDGGRRARCHLRAGDGAPRARVTLVQRDQAYVDAGVALGYSDRRIMLPPHPAQPRRGRRRPVQHRPRVRDPGHRRALASSGSGQQPPDPGLGLDALRRRARTCSRTRGRPWPRASPSCSRSSRSTSSATGCGRSSTPGSASDDRGARGTAGRGWRAPDGRRRPARGPRPPGRVPHERGSGPRGERRVARDRGGRDRRPRRGVRLGQERHEPGDHGSPAAEARAAVSGSIRLDGDELVGIPEKRYRTIRGERIGMVFQDPLTALDPLYRAGEQVAEALRFHFGMGQSEALRRARDLFARCRAPGPRRGRRASIPTSSPAGCASG